MVKSLSTT